MPVRPQLRIVQSNQNSRLKELRRALAQPDRAQGGRVGIEGPKLIAEALRSGLGVRCVFVAQGHEGLLEGLALPPETEVLLASGSLLESALATETPQPIAALVEPPQWTWEHLLENKGGRALVVILAGLQDPGNLGTIIRSAEAFGASGILSLPGTVSEWNPKAVRASAGSIFRVPLVAADANDGLGRLRKAGVKVWTTGARGASAADAIDLTQPAAMLIGNEGSGVPKEIAAMADGAITIPCPGPVESLNAATAASVLLYEASRQRTAGVSASERSRKLR